MADPWYPEIVKVFYCNLKISDRTLCYKVKGVDIKLTNEVWTEIKGFKLNGEKCHLGIEGFHKFTVYQDNLRNPEEIRDYSHYKIGGMKIDDQLVVFVISWILMPRGSNHAQATIEDLYLLKVIKENIQVDWPAAISDNLLKVTRLESAMLPYCVFISKIPIHFGADCVKGWQFKSEQVEEDEDVGGSFSIPYRARSEFERALLKEIRSLKAICLGTREDFTEIKEHLNFENQNEEGADEKETGEEGSTPDESAAMQEEESEDEDVEEECGVLHIEGVLKGLNWRKGDSCCWSCCKPCCKNLDHYSAFAYCGGKDTGCRHDRRYEEGCPFLWFCDCLNSLSKRNVEESCETYSKSNQVAKNALHHIGLRHGVDGWVFKDENQNEEEAPATHSVDASSASFRPKSEFEKFMDEDNEEDEEKNEAKESDDYILLRDMI
ncbi:hypothetical protein V8G54_012375 [Vigna mungo]|uniref:Uncharacterized protein n=1 Tax=Vigna mungo TaxID=3915 RepID=A0AAQ3S3Z2_VIGMU